MTPLHNIGEFLRQTLAAVPLWAVQMLFVGSLVLLLIWVLRLPRARVVPAEPTGRWDENLKVGASIALVIQILIYSFFA